MNHFNNKQINRTIDRLNKKENLTKFDFDILKYFSDTNSRYIRNKLSLKQCIYISELFNYNSEERLRWLKIAENNFTETSPLKFINLLYLKIGKYYFHSINYDDNNLKISKIYFDKVKHYIPEALYYLGCILMIEEVTSKYNIKDRNFNESYRYLNMAVKRGIDEAKGQRDFVESLLNR